MIGPAENCFYYKHSVHYLCFMGILFFGRFKVITLRIFSSQSWKFLAILLSTRKRLKRYFANLVFILIGMLRNSLLDGNEDIT